MHVISVENSKIDMYACQLRSNYKTYCDYKLVECVLTWEPSPETFWIHDTDR